MCAVGLEWESVHELLSIQSNFSTMEFYCAKLVTDVPSADEKGPLNVRNEIIAH